MTRSQKPPAKRWLFHGILADSPISSEDEYFSAREILAMLQGHDLVSGIRISGLKLTPLPERAKKGQKAVEKTGETTPKPLTGEALGIKLKAGPEAKTGV